MRSLPVASTEGRDAGHSLAELLVVVTILAVAAAAGVPAVAQVADAGRSWAAAQALAAEFRGMRLAAIASGVTGGYVFDRHPAGWLMRRCRDGNGDGLSRSDIASGLDACEPAGPPIELRWRGVVVAVHPGIPGPDGTPPSADPVRFGAADVVSFTPDGTATPGTLFVQSMGGRQFAVRVAGVTGRTRLLRYDAGGRRWTD
jgi:prepilin-type N-terminal cleavage/methylation domain-containing protein